jgi:hypothetical protein
MNFSQMNEGQRKVTIDDINQRWWQLYGLEKEWGEKALNYLFLTNSGGAIATLSFIGAATVEVYLPCLKLALIAFVLGIFFVGLSIARAYHYMLNLFEGYQKDVNKFYEDSVSQQFLTSEDGARVKSSVWQYIFPYASFVFFILGCILGGYSLFRIA